MDSQTIFREALALSETERLILAERLLESMPMETDDANEDAFLSELRRRSAEIDDGRAELIPWSQLKSEKD